VLDRAVSVSYRTVYTILSILFQANSFLAVMYLHFHMVHFCGWYICRRRNLWLSFQLRYFGAKISG